MKIYGLKTGGKRKNTSSEKPEYVRPCIEFIETEGWPGGLSGMEKWYASILLMPEYKAYGLSEDEAESRLREWRNEVSDRPIRTPSEDRSDIIQARKKVFDEGFQRFKCETIKELVPDSCVETHGRECPWKMNLEGYQEPEQRKRALVEAKAHWNKSGWEKYLVREYGPFRGKTAVNLYNASGVYATKCDLSPDFLLGLGLERWAKEIEKFTGHRPHHSAITGALHVLEDEGLVEVRWSKFEWGKANNSHQIRRVLPIPPVPERIVRRNRKSHERQNPS